MASLLRLRFYKSEVANSHTSTIAGFHYVLFYEITRSLILFPFRTINVDVGPKTLRNWRRCRNLYAKLLHFYIFFVSRYKYFRTMLVFFIKNMIWLLNYKITIRSNTSTDTTETSVTMTNQWRLKLRQSNLISIKCIWIKQT